MKASIEVVLDTGPLVAWLSQSDQHHRWCADVFSRLSLPVVTCESVVAEATHRLRKCGPGIAGLCELLESGELRLEPVSDLAAVSAFMRKFGADFADASVVWLSEKYPKAKVFTVDFGDFRVYRRFESQPLPLIEKP